MLYIPTCLRARVVDVPTCLRASVVDVPSCLRVNVPINANFSLRATLPINVLMFHTACQWSNVACQRAKQRASFSNWLSSIPKNARVFQTFLYEMLREISILYHYKKKNLYVYLSYINTVLYFIPILLVIIKKKVWNFYFLLFFLEMKI